LIEKIYQTLKTVFDHISKHLKLRQKYSAARRIFNPLLGVWKCGQTQSWVFDVLLTILLLTKIPFKSLQHVDTTLSTMSQPGTSQLFWSRHLRPASDYRLCFHWLQTWCIVTVHYWQIVNFRISYWREQETIRYSVNKYTPLAPIKNFLLNV